MELWIRSQDRKLLCKCDSLFIEEEQYKRKGKYRIMANNGWLGEYDKLERALEVLDEIQKILKPQLIIKDSGKIIGTFEDTIIREGATYELKEISTYVYEMPKD